jgi:DNA-binding transcriptional ArsR family regulator
MDKDFLVLEPGDEQAQKIGRAIGSQTAGDILQALRSGPKTSTEITEELGIPMSTAKYHIENLLDAGLLEVAETKYSVKGREVKVYRLKDQVLIVAPKTPNARSLLIRYASLFGITIAGSLVILALGSVSMMAAQKGIAPSPGAPGGAGWSGASQEAVNAYPTLPVTTAGVREAKDAGITAATIPADGMSNLSQYTAPAATPVPTPLPSTMASVAPSVQGAVPVEIHAGGPGAAGSPLFPDLAIAFFLGGCVVIAALLLYEVYRWRKAAGKRAG